MSYITPDYQIRSIVQIEHVDDPLTLLVSHPEPSSFFLTHSIGKRVTHYIPHPELHHEEVGGAGTREIRRLQPEPTSLKVRTSWMAEFCPWRFPRKNCGVQEQSKHATRYPGGISCVIGLDLPLTAPYRLKSYRS